MVCMKNEGFHRIKEILQWEWENESEKRSAMKYVCTKNEGFRGISEISRRRRENESE